MHLGGPVFETTTPDEWAVAHIAAGYRAAYWPDIAEADEADYTNAARSADLTIAEVGAWSNPLSGDDALRRAAIARCQEKLAAADRVGARCCVNISGSRGEIWDGPHPANLTEDTFAIIVDSVRDIVDAVKPTRTTYALETMPWMYPDSAESYDRLFSAIDRQAFGVHFDPVNLINSPSRYYDNGSLISEFIALLGPRIRSCHAKDILIGQQLTLHLDEVVPGTGNLDYATLLRRLDAIDSDMPIMLEHLSIADYARAARHIQSVAAEQRIEL